MMFHHDAPKFDPDSTRRINKTAASILLAVCVVALAGHAAAANPLTFEDGEFKLTPTARLDLNHAWADSDTESLGNHYLTRRAALGLEGQFTNDWEFEIGYDFTGEGEYKDVYLAYEGWDVGTITVGQFKVPYGLEELTSSKNIMMIERALPTDAFNLSRRLGIGFNHSGARHTFAAMGFKRTIDEDDGKGVGARYTFAAIDTDANLLHLGASLVTEKQPEDRIKFNARPEAKPIDVKLVNTGKIRDVKRINRLGLELAWQTGPFTVQTEWMRAAVDRHSRPDVAFDGWYVAGSWMLNGGQRRYKDGRFKSPSLAHPFATLELTTRYSRLNLNDGPEQGGKQDNISVGINWYISEYGRVMLNYISVDSDRRGVSDDPNIILLQTQFFL